MKLRLDSMSADELWVMHEEIGKILSERITAEKRELERRLAQLKREYGGVDSTGGDTGLGVAGRKYPKVRPKDRIQRRPRQVKPQHPEVDSMNGDIGRPLIRRKYPQVLPKYRNPKAPHETWAGRGKQPRWVKSALEAGCKIEELLIREEASQGNKAREVV